MSDRPTAHSQEEAAVVDSQVRANLIRGKPPTFSPSNNIINQDPRAVSLPGEWIVAGRPRVPDVCSKELAQVHLDRTIACTRNEFTSSLLDHELADANSP